MSPQRSDLDSKARRYLISNPGNPLDIRNQHAAIYCKQILDHKMNISTDLTERMNQVLTYRLHVMDRATRYKRALRVDFPDCCDWDLDVFRDELSALSRRPDGRDVYGRAKAILNLVWDKDLFDEPTDEQGREYDKGERYLVAIAFSQKWTTKEAEERFAMLQRNVPWVQEPG